MANKRAEGLTMLGFWVNPEVVAHIDAMRGPLTRSQFLRQAVVEKIKAAGIDVIEEQFYAPDRSKQPVEKPWELSKPELNSPIEPYKSHPKAEKTSIVDSVDYARNHPKKSERNSKNPNKNLRYSVPQAPRGEAAEEANPFLAEDIERQAASSDSGGYPRDPAGLPKGARPGESGSGSEALRNQRVSMRESIQGVSQAAADIARGGALIAAQRVREARLSASKGKSGGSTESKGGPTPRAAPVIAQSIAGKGPAPDQSGSAVGVGDVSRRKGAAKGGSMAVPGKKL